METEILNLSNELEYILIYDQGFLQPDSSKKIRKIAAKAKEYLQSILDNELYQKLRKYEDLTQFYQDKCKNAIAASKSLELEIANHKSKLKSSQKVETCKRDENILKSSNLSFPSTIKNPETTYHIDDFFDQKEINKNIENLQSELIEIEENEKFIESKIKQKEELIQELERKHTENIENNKKINFETKLLEKENKLLVEENTEIQKISKNLSEKFNNLDHKQAFIRKLNNDLEQHINNLNEEMKKRLKMKESFCFSNKTPENVNNAVPMHKNQNLKAVLSPNKTNIVVSESDNILFKVKLETSENKSIDYLEIENKKNSEICELGYSESNPFWDNDQSQKVSCFVEKINEGEAKKTQQEKIGRDCCSCKIF